MKGKITIVLFSLVLAFGMLAVSCDNGNLPDRNDKDALTLVAYEDAGLGLPVTALADAPKKLTGKALWKTLYGANNRFEVSAGVYSQIYTLDTVKPRAEHTTQVQKDIAAKYAGLPIVIKDSRAP
jgi:hypothetical protein